MTEGTRSRVSSLGRIAVPMLLATSVVIGQTPARTVFRAEANYVPLIVTPRESTGRLVRNLTRADFQIFEDGVEQALLDFASTDGGRVFGDLATRAANPTGAEGLVVPPARPSDVASRIFIIFIDDLHLTPSLTPNVRNVLRQIRDKVVHENDLVGFVSTGFSGVEMNPAYDFGHRRFDEVVNRVMGAGPTVPEMIAMRQGGDGLAELNFRVNVAFRTAYDLLSQMEHMTSLRKAFIWVSSGYSLNPFKDARFKHEQDSYSGQDAFGNSSMQFKEADLLRELAEVTRAAHRANVTFFPIDPRGLMAGMGAEVRDQLSYAEVRDFETQTTDTLRVLANETGGIAAVQTNDFSRFLQTIDAMMSDYYVLGYQSSNPDRLHVVRKIEVRIKRPGVTLVPGIDYRDVYTVRRR